MRRLAPVDPHHGHESAVGGRIVHDQGVRGQVHLDGGQTARGAGGDHGDFDIAGAGAGAHHHRRDVGGEVEDHPRFVLARFGRLHRCLVRGAFERGDDRHRLRIRRRAGDEFADRAPGDSLGDPLRRTEVVGARLGPSAAAVRFRGFRGRGLRNVLGQGFRRGSRSSARRCRRVRSSSSRRAWDPASGLPATTGDGDDPRTGPGAVGSSTRTSAVVASSRFSSLTARRSMSGRVGRRTI